MRCTAPSTWLRRATKSRAWRSAERWLRIRARLVDGVAHQRRRRRQTVRDVEQPGRQRRRRIGEQDRSAVLEQRDAGRDVADCPGGCGRKPRRVAQDLLQLSRRAVVRLAPYVQQLQHVPVIEVEDAGGAHADQEEGGVGQIGRVLLGRPVARRAPLGRDQAPVAQDAVRARPQGQRSPGRVGRGREVGHPARRQLDRFGEPHLSVERSRRARRDEPEPEGREAVLLGLERRGEGDVEEAPQRRFVRQRARGVVVTAGVQPRQQTGGDVAGILHAPNNITPGRGLRSTGERLYR